MKTTEKILLLAGAAAVGATLGLLFAPKSGKALRKDISNTMDSLKDEAGVLVKEGKEFAEKTIKNVAESVKSIENSDAVKEPYINGKA